MLFQNQSSSLRRLTSSLGASSEQKHFTLEAQGKEKPKPLEG
jgi:hypothetical protein